MSIWDILKEKKSQEWQRVPRGALLVFQYGEKPMHLIHTVTEQALMDEPDEIREGSVNRIPAYIGFKEWRSGPDGIYVDYEAIQWKEKTT